MSNARENLYTFFERPYPSANAILLRGTAPVLVDPGFGSDFPALAGWLLDLGVFPEHLALIVNTHYHSDHVGGNHTLQQRYGIDVAAHVHDALMVNRRDANACAAEWLRQPVESYVVNRPLREGDVIDTGMAQWEVIHTPGHTVGHISLYERTRGVLIAGDTAHASDVGWLNFAIEGVDSLTRSIESVVRLNALAPTIALSGHGPAIADPKAAFASALRRFERWRSDPEAAAWHAAKRIFAFAMMIEGGIPADRVAPYLATSPWVHSFAEAPFAITPLAFADALTDEMLRSGAATWRKDRLIARAPHTPTDARWPRSATVPSMWEP